MKDKVMEEIMKKMVGLWVDKMGVGGNNIDAPIFSVREFFWILGWTKKKNKDIKKNMGIDAE